jgi:hypothetical protein
MYIKSHLARYIAWGGIVMTIRKISLKITFCMVPNKMSGTAEMAPDILYVLPDTKLWLNVTHCFEHLAPVTVLSDTVAIRLCL